MARPRKILNCLVCCVPITHAHMGVDSCRACGVFYRRTLKLKYRLECTCGGKDITRKDKIVSCRKCRFEKMRELVNRATAGEITCVVDGEFDYKQGIEITSGTPEISMQELQENDIHLDTNESNENNSAADDLPSFIDHNSYFDYEPSCSDTPLLNKMKSAYSTMCLVRKSCEFNGLHHLEMHAQLRNEKMALRFAKSSNMIPFSQIFFVGIIDFAKSAFPAFSKMSTEDRNALVQTNFPLIQSLDGSYRSYHNFPDEDAVMTSYTTFVSHDTLDIFFKEVENKDEAKETFRMNMERTIKSTKFQFEKVNPSKEEFVALFGLALWNDLRVD
uniref:Nuclear receptor n=1 Tax=Pristionchus pacificus TaxID=54126 RepID=A0A2A6D1Y7_PRIPA|eukprot:PDM84399.1 nuclear receptor [Pristionchus pacificus]